MKMTSSLGKLFIITSFGESHGRCVGAVIDGCPAGLGITDSDIQSELDKRKPGGSSAATARKEADKVDIISGTFNYKTTGAPICLVVWNQDIDSSDYEKNRSLPRPGQADYTAFMKYGGFNDYRGGGRFSGRLTASLVMGGAIAKKVLSLLEIEIIAYTVAIGGISAEARSLQEIRENRDKNPLRCADPKAAQEMARAIGRVKKEGDSLGGIIEGIALNVPVGVGEPVFDTLDGELAKAMLSIPAVKGVEFGSGFSATNKKGSENNDPFTIKDGRIVTATNNAGGILGGISNGMPIVLRVAIKPTPSIAKSQPTVNIRNMENTSLTVKGRHDACIAPRAVVVVEAMMAITICDLAMRARLIPRVIK
jgi:chorismate synthase